MHGCELFRNLGKDKKFISGTSSNYSQKTPTICQSKNLLNAVLKCQTTPQNAKLVIFGIENASLATLDSAYTSQQSL